MDQMLHNFRVIALIVVALLLVVAVIRWRRTVAWHTEYNARADTVRLLVLALIGQIGDLARSRFDVRSIGFWLLSVGLLPVIVGVLYYVWRLFGAYRASAQSNSGGQ